jgi:hypothetical protein
MTLKVNLAGTNINITFLGRAKEALPFFNAYFHDFIALDQEGNANITISLLENPNHGFPVRTNSGNPIFEQLLSTPDVAAWLREVPGYKEDFPISEKTICSFCLDGLLLFDPINAAGRIYLMRQDLLCFRPLYRLFWMYFAQVLGEECSCFLHGAALIKDNEGYLFMGDSGAGKSTIANLCREYTVLSDDSPIFRKQDGGGYRVFPSPFHQMNPSKGLDKDTIAASADVRGLYFLIKDASIYLEEVSKIKAISMIIKRYIHFFSYLSTQARSALFDLLLEACHNIPTRYIHFCRNQDVSQVITGG